MRYIIALLVIFVMKPYISFSQNEINTIKKSQKGTTYMYWGWNRGWYSDSDVHFKGANYDFTLYNLVAKDRQSPFGWDPYFKIDRLTIPQYNFRLGYFFKDNYSVSFGVDHMKYVMVEYQTVKISGTIDSSYSSYYGGSYNNDDLDVANSFLYLEHTDGLNYLNIEVRRFDELYKIGKLSFNITEGIGAGMLMPKTNAKFLEQERNDEFHIAGFGISAVGAINITFWEHFFLQSEFKVGYINMPDVRITKYDTDKASQAFFFSQFNTVVGVKYNFKNK